MAVPMQNIAEIRSLIKQHKWDALKSKTLNGLDLTKAPLEEAQLPGVAMEETIFYKAILKAAELGHADLKDAQFEKAKLNAAHLEAADLTGAIFLNADLRGANFKNAKLLWANFSGAQIDDKTNLEGTLFFDDHIRDRRDVHLNRDLNVLLRDDHEKIDFHVKEAFANDLVRIIYILKDKFGLEFAIEKLQAVIDHEPSGIVQTKGWFSLGTATVARPLWNQKCLDILHTALADLQKGKSSARK